MTQRENVLITGGAGFIGSNLVRRLICEDSLRLLVLDDLSTGFAANVADLPIDFQEGSVLDPDILARLARRCSAIVHLAAVPSVPRSIAHPVHSHHANATGTLNVLEAARLAGATVILASSSSVYGANPTLPKSEDLRCVPVSPYAVSKLAAEAYGLAYAHCYGLPVLALRFFNVFGPMQSAAHAYAAVIPSFISAALRDEPVTIFGDGLQSRDFTYVGTVTEVVAQALHRRVLSDDSVNLAFGTSTTLVELVSHLEHALQRAIRREHAPPRPGDVRNSVADASRLRSLFPDVHPEPLDRALAATVRWWLETDPGRAQLG